MGYLDASSEEELILKVAADKGDKTSEYQLGELYLQQGKMEEAVKYLKRAESQGYDIRTELQKKDLLSVVIRLLAVGDVNEKEGTLFKGTIYLGGGGESVTFGEALTKESSALSAKKTLFSEGSITKVRLAGLAYILEQEELLDTKEKLNDVFTKDKLFIYLEGRYGVEKAIKIHDRIEILLKGVGDSADLNDLFSHMAGIGDLTDEQASELCSKDFERVYGLDDLLLVDFDTTDPIGKPHAIGKNSQGERNIAEYGKVQYSNLGYMLAGLALEYKTGKSLNKLYDDYMLHPTEGRAVGRDLDFSDTFSLGVERERLPIERMRTPFYMPHRGDVQEAAFFDGCHAAGGTKTSALELQEFMKEYFRGFPGTTEHEKDVNKFFKDESIRKIWEEAKAKEGKNISDTNEDNRTILVQLVGAQMILKIPDGISVPAVGGPLVGDDLESIFKPENVVSYQKAGGIPGCESFVIYDAKKEEVTVSVALLEGVTPKIQKLVTEARGFFIDEAKDAARLKLAEAFNLAGSLDIFDKEMFMSEFLEESSELEGLLDKVIDNVHQEVAGRYNLESSQTRVVEDNISQKSRVEKITESRNQGVNHSKGGAREI